jgi:streptogramin lyase
MKLRATLFLLGLAAVVAAGTGLAAATPAASVVARVHVGAGAGVPAVDRGVVWVPNTLAGTLSRVDVVRQRVVATVKLGRPALGGGYLDSAAVAGGRVWVARDSAAEIDRVDPGTNRVAQRIAVDPRPGGLATGGGFVWAFHFQGASVTRIDPATGTKRVFSVPGALGTGIVYAADAVWLLTESPSALIELDPETGEVRARIPIASHGAPRHGVADTWWVAAGGGSLWLANPNYDRVTRVDVAAAKVRASIPVPVSTPFGVVFFRGAAWVAGSGKVVRIDPTRDRPGPARALAKGSSALFTQLAAGPAGLWATDYDRAVLYRLRVS